MPELKPVSSAKSSCVKGEEFASMKSGFPRAVAVYFHGFPFQRILEALKLLKMFPRSAMEEDGKGKLRLKLPKIGPTLMMKMIQLRMIMMMMMTLMVCVQNILLMLWNFILKIQINGCENACWMVRC